MKQLQILEQQHLEIKSKADWKDTPESKELEIEYDKLNQVIRDKCLECNTLARITCQYH
jgi:hypothetical protein